MKLHASLLVLIVLCASASAQPVVDRIKSLKVRFANQRPDAGATAVAPEPYLAVGTREAYFSIGESDFVAARLALEKTCNADYRLTGERLEFESGCHGGPCAVTLSVCAPGGNSASNGKLHVLINASARYGLISPTREEAAAAAKQAFVRECQERGDGAEARDFKSYGARGDARIIVVGICRYRPRN